MLDKPSKLNIASLPTPIVKLETLSERLNRNLWLKRDDFTGVEWSGNKVRKLEYIFYDALKNNCDYVITCGGKQSNHCRAVAAVAARHGIKCILFLAGEDDEHSKGNLFLDRLFGAEIRFIPDSGHSNFDIIMRGAGEELSERGYKPYIIPLGGSTPLGAWGYFDAYEEIVSFEEGASINFDLISMAVGSSGTIAGIIAGSIRSGKKRNITGISVLAEASPAATMAGEICEGMGYPVEKSDINIVDKYIAPGYGSASTEVIEFIKTVARTEGVLFDPVYTGKALYGLVNELEQGEYRDCENVLFMHTGGVFGIFGQPDSFR